MKSKVEYLKQSNGLKVYVRNNSLLKVYVRINSLLDSEARRIDSTLFNSWRCGYVEFSLPNGMGYQVVESIYSSSDEYFISKPSRIAAKVERVIDSALVHGGITFCKVNHDSKKNHIRF